jgi:DNA-binding CsgD family transcriptional regulator
MASTSSVTLVLTYERVFRKACVLYKRLQELSDTADANTLYASIQEFGEELGFEYAGINCVEVRTGEDRTVVFMNNPPAGFAEASRAPDDVRRDPVMNRLYSIDLQHRPFFYDQSLYVDAQCGDLWEEQAKYGYKTGIAVSMNAWGGKQVMIGFDRHDPLPKDETKLVRMLADFQLLAVHAIQPALNLMLPKVTAPSLTEKQLEVLRWISLGKTAWETGQIMGIAQRSVTAHLSVIFQKLAVTSKAQAITRALGFGLI